MVNKGNRCHYQPTICLYALPLRLPAYPPFPVTETKVVRVYKVFGLTTLLCDFETWTVPTAPCQKLNHFHTTSLRKLFGIKWQYKIPDTKVLIRANLSSIHTIFVGNQLHWTDRVVRMSDHRLPKNFMF